MQTRALISLLAGFIVWGFFPLYFTYLQAVRADQVLYGRILFSGLFLLLFFVVRRRFNEVMHYILNPRVLIVAGISAFFISANWFVYIWAVQNKLTLQASLGYFITPMVNVLIGIYFFDERLDRWQLGGVVFAVVGVLYQLLMLGVMPWVTLILGCSFAIYGGIRKKYPLRPMEGLLAEMIILIPFASFALGWIYHLGNAYEFGNQTLLLLAYLSSGVITVLPLLLFLNAVPHLAMSTVGFAQFITPTLQFIIAVFVLHEPFSVHKLITFILIWLGVGLYSVHLIQSSRRTEA